MVVGPLRYRARLIGVLAAAAAMPLAMAAAPTAIAGQNGQGIGVMYSAPIQYLQLCGNDQYGHWACTAVEHVNPSSTQAPYQTVWFVNGSGDMVYGANPPAASPGWWWLGGVRVWAWSSYPNARFPESTCNIVTSQPSNWQRCDYLIPGSPPPPPPPPTPPPTPAPSSPIPAPAPPTSTPTPLPPPAATPPPPTPRLAGRATLSLHRSRRVLHDGQAVQLWGQVTLASVPAGLVLKLEAWVGAPERWLTFGVATTLSNGSFWYRYRFTRTTGRQVYLMRAVLPQQYGYAAKSVASRLVRVTVIG